LTKGAKESNVAIVGGETAILPDLLNDTEENTFDLVGSVFGVCDKNRLILGNKIAEGDVIIGLESNGLHSNGYSLARKVLIPKFKLQNSNPLLDKSIGEELLMPTRIYVKPILDLLHTERTSIHGLAHITGGSFSKLSRLNNKIDFNLNNVAQPTGIFKLIQKTGRISYVEMYSTFNMGIGFCIIVSRTAMDKIESVLKKHKLKHRQIGHVTRGHGRVSVSVMEKKYLLND
jgi:phosphoribosylformylglycinamidine cyclo-ligase